MHIQARIPSFEVHAYHRGEFVKFTHEHLLGRWSVLFFYPADFTFVCPTELADLAERYEDFLRLGVEVVSISTDTHFVHKAWHDSSEMVGSVRFPMLADPTGQLARAFGVYVESEGLARRGTFVASPDGLVRIVELHDDGIGRDASELLRKVQAAQYVAEHPGEACPARWRPGARTLAPSVELVGKL